MEPVERKLTVGRSPSLHLTGLAFNQRLTKDAKLTTAEQVKRLRSLHEELEKLDQEQTETSSLDAVKRELMEPGLLVHKDKSVKALVACCFADMLRLYAPDAPYTEAELKVGMLPASLRISGRSY